MRLNCKQIMQYTGGRYIVEPIDASAILTGMTWDSRDVAQNCLFAALPGQKVDGIAFAKDALRAGASAIICEKSPEPSACVMAKELGCAIIEVPSTEHAISDLASGWRDHLHALVIGVTGSVGKTTTKNLMRDVCSTRFKTVATVSNQNNELGVPNTILSADADTEVVIVEMGMRGLGQITELCQIARPDWGVIVNVRESHMELLGSKENIARAKMELLLALPESKGRAFLNIEDEWTGFLVRESRLEARDIQAIGFGNPAEAGDGETQPEAAIAKSEEVAEDPASSGSEGSEFPQGFPRVIAKGIELDDEGCPDFRIEASGFEDFPTEEPPMFQYVDMAETEAECRMHVQGAHVVTDAVAAAAVGMALGIPITEVAEAIAAYVPSAGRLETVIARDGFVILNDSYNAGPDSMRAALSALASMKVAGKRVAVLGDMGELGRIERECHLGVGRFSAACGIDELYCVGSLASLIAEGALEAGMGEESIHSVQTTGEALGLLEGNLAASDAVLVKASHFMNLNRIVEGLVR